MKWYDKKHFLLYNFTPSERILVSLDDNSKKNWVGKLFKKIYMFQWRVGGCVDVHRPGMEIFELWSLCKSRVNEHSLLLIHCSSFAVIQEIESLIDSTLDFDYNSRIPASGTCPPQLLQFPGSSLEQAQRLDLWSESRQCVPVGWVKHRKIIKNRKYYFQVLIISECQLHLYIVVFYWTWDWT